MIPLCSESSSTVTSDKDWFIELFPSKHILQEGSSVDPTKALYEPGESPLSAEDRELEEIQKQIEAEGLNNSLNNNNQVHVLSLSYTVQLSKETTLVYLSLD